MFDAPPAARRRPMFGVSAALHAALGLALFVPPLFATPEPPDPEVRMLPFFPVENVHIGDAPARAPGDLLRRVNEGHALAIDAVRRWRYRAATVEGRRVPVYLTVVVTFSLR